MLSLYQPLTWLFQAAYLLIFLRVILSWIPHDENHIIIQWVYRLTEPVLAPFRNLVPTGKIGVDLSPFFAVITISIIKALLFQLLF